MGVLSSSVMVVHGKSRCVALTSANFGIPYLAAIVTAGHTNSSQKPSNIDNDSKGIEQLSNITSFGTEDLKFRSWYRNFIPLDAIEIPVRMHINILITFASIFPPPEVNKGHECQFQMMALVKILDWLLEVGILMQKAFSALNRTLDMISQDACAFYDQQALVPFAGGVFDNQEGARIASFIKAQHKVAILQNHGLLSVGRLSIDEAAWWQISFEMCAKAQILADSALRPGEKFVFAEEQNILDTREEIGTPEMGWFCLAAYVEEEEWHSRGEHKL
ncbi:class II aldolase/adducin N-terminal [Lentinula raphanica]|nr:class II aldolase/adducin N-terminal [Lentinula raphanica]